MVGIFSVEEWKKQLVLLKTPIKTIKIVCLGVLSNSGGF
jgi:hypothetical protein